MRQVGIGGQRGDADGFVRGKGPGHVIGASGGAVRQRHVPVLVAGRRRDGHCDGHGGSSLGNHAARGQDEVFKVPLRGRVPRGDPLLAASPVGVHFGQLCPASPVVVEVGAVRLVRLVEVRVIIGS